MTTPSPCCGSTSPPRRCGSFPAHFSWKRSTGPAGSRRRCGRTRNRLGTGLSRGTTIDFSLDASVGELESLLERLDARSVTLLASSASGPVAVRTAARSERVARLVLCCTYVSGPLTFHNAGARKSMLELVRTSWGLGSRMLATLLLPDAGAQTVEAFAAFQRHVPPRTWRRAISVRCTTPTPLLTRIACRSRHSCSTTGTTSPCRSPPGSTWWPGFRTPG